MLNSSSSPSATVVEIPTATVPPRLERFAREMSRAYANGNWPESLLYSVMADALRVVGRASKDYNDQTCVELNLDELEAEGRAKLIRLFQGKSPAVKPSDIPILERISDRKQLFKFIATCFKNHARGLVHKHRFTAKRTGSKVPPKGSPDLAQWSREHQKPEVSLDANPEIRSHLEFRAALPSEPGGEADEDMEETLNPAEFMVYQQFAHPNAAALALATIDAFRGRTPSEITIKAEHLAAGVGLTVQEFHAVAEGVRSKFEDYRSGRKPRSAETITPAPEWRRSALSPSEFLVYQQLVHPNAPSKALASADRSPVQVRHLAAGIGMSEEVFKRLSVSVKNKLMDNSTTQQHAAVAALEAVFGVQVPRSLPGLVVKRLFTLAARAQFERVTPEVETLLVNIGAEVPRPDASGNLNCFGVLFSRNHQVCSACASRGPCQAKAANFGLDHVTLSPALLSARASVRTAEVIGEAAPPPSAAPARLLEPRRSASPSSEREEEIRSFLEQHFKPSSDHGEQYFTHRAERADRRKRHIVWVGSRAADEHPDLSKSFLVRFCNPSPELQSRLVKLRGGFYASEASSAKQVCEMVAAHADRLFTDEFAAAPACAPAKPKAKPTPASQPVRVGIGSLVAIIASRARHLCVEIIDGLRVTAVRGGKKP